MPKPNSDCRATERKHPWPMVRLGELGTMVRGNGIKRSETIETGFPCLRYGEIYTSFDVILDKPRSFVPKELFDRSVKIKKGDLVFTLTGENTEEIAKALAFLGDYEIAAGGDLAVWTGHGCDSKYLAYLMYSPQLISQKAATGNGNIVVHTSIKKLQQLEIPLPSLSVQREIVARLERELAAVEKIKKDLEALVETAKADYVAECRVIFERIAQEHPKVSLDDACEFIKDGTHQTPTYTDDIYRGYKFLSSKDVVTGEIDWSKIRYIPKSLHDELYLHVAPQRGDILLAKNGTTGIGALVETDEVFDIYVSLALLRFKAGNNPRYLWYAVNSPQAREQYNAGLRGSGVPNLHLTEIRKVHICLPSVQIQDKVVSELDAIKARAEKLEAKAREGVAVCETMRKAILKEAFE